MTYRSALALAAAGWLLAACQSSGGGVAPGAYDNETQAEAIRRIEREGAETRRRSGTP